MEPTNEQAGGGQAAGMPPETGAAPAGTPGGASTPTQAVPAETGVAPGTPGGAQAQAVPVETGEASMEAAGASGGAQAQAVSVAPTEQMQPPQTAPEPQPKTGGGKFKLPDWRTTWQAMPPKKKKTVLVALGAIVVLIIVIIIVVMVMHRPDEKAQGGGGGSGEKTFSITYNLNEGTWQETSPQTGSTSDAFIALSTTTPKREGYEFKGWCTNETKTSGCSGGAEYAAGKLWALFDGENTLELWAMWKPTSPALQDWKGCDDLEPGTTITLTDLRDENVYDVAKLGDENCWMTENLRLGGKSEMKLTDSDSNVAKFTLPASAKTGFTEGETTTAWVYVNEKMGGYYSWTAATANTSEGRKFVRSTQGSICPKGWRLPTSGDSGEFQRMAEKYGDESNPEAWSAALRETGAGAPAFTLAGYCENGTQGCNKKEGGEFGVYWSTSAPDAEKAWLFAVTESEVQTAMDFEKNLGAAVRCLTD